MKHTKPTLLITTTVDNTLRSLLREQLQFLAGKFDVHVAASPSSESESFAASCGVTFHPVPMQRGISPLKDLPAIWRMVKCIRQIQPDCVHSYTPKAGLVTMTAARMVGARVRIHTFTGLLFPSRSGVTRRLLTLADKAIASNATRVIPESTGVAKQLHEANVTAGQAPTLGAGNIVGVNLDRFSPENRELVGSRDDLRAEYGIAPEDFAFVFVGRLHREKGITELLEAFDHLPKHAHLLIAGRFDEVGTISDEQRHRIENDPRIHLLGFLPDVRPALHASDALVLPSYREGYPNVLLEAAAMERPVISTMVNGATEFVEPGHNGWLVPIQSTAELAAAMRECLLADEQTLRAMGQAGRTKVIQNFDRRTQNQRVADLYFELIGQRAQ